MELRYSVTDKQEPDDFKNSDLNQAPMLSIISSQNVLVFTRVLTRSDAYKNRILIYTVCVVDLNCPYEPHVIKESLDQITHLIFNSTGNQLLIVTSLGIVQLFCKSSGLHDWKNTHTSDWTGEDILHINFFHTGTKPCLQSTDVKINASYSEKFTVRPHKPTLTSIGNCPVPGFFALSASGLILTCVLSSKGTVVDQTKVVLGQSRDNFSVATAALAPSGHIHVAAWMPEMIKCWKVEMIRVDGDIDSGGRAIDQWSAPTTLKLNVQAAQCFCPAKMSDQKPSSSPWQQQHHSKSDGTIHVRRLRYTEVEDPNSLLVVIDVENKNNSLSATNVLPVTSTLPQLSTEIRGLRLDNLTHFVQRYQLQERNRPLLKLFGTSSQSSTSSTTIKEWVCVAEWVNMSKVVEISSAPRQILFSTQLPFVITVSTIDGNIYGLNKETLNQIGSYNLHSGRSTADDLPPLKKKLFDKYAVSLCHTWTGLSMVALDNRSNIYFITLLKATEIGHIWLMYILFLFELSLISGQDWFDLLVVTPTASIITITERLSEIFYQHPPSITQQLQTRFLVLKNSLLRLSSNWHQRAVEARVQAQLTAIQRLFRSVRPVTSDILSSEKNVASIIQGFIENRNSLEILDIDKAVDQLTMSTNILDCQVDPSISTDLQPLLQFCADLALYLLFLLAQNAKEETSRDAKTIQYLREILYVSRIWYRHNKLVIPQMFKKSDKVDVWAQLYKLLTRLAQFLPGEPDSSFFDECVLLETQVVCREVPLHIPARGMLAVIYSNSSSAPCPPPQFYFGMTETEASGTTGSFIIPGRSLEGALPALQPLDPLYHHFIGANGPQLQCTRCWGVRGSWWGDGNSMWEQEWAHSCICSGHWGPSPSVKPPKAA